MIICVTHWAKTQHTAHFKKQLGSWQRQLGKTAVVTLKTAYIVSRDRKTVYRLEAGKITFLQNAYKLSIATHSRISQACLWVRAYIVVIVAEPGFMIRSKPLWHGGAIAGKWPVRINLPLTQIQYLHEVLGFCSAGHICWQIAAISPVKEATTAILTFVLNWAESVVLTSADYECRLSMALPEANSTTVHNLYRLEQPALVCHGLQL